MGSKQFERGILTMQPIVELVGLSRLLVENYQGVLSYSNDEIQIKVCYGNIIISGSGLQLMEMSRIKLVVCGRIEGIQILGR